MERIGEFGAGDAALNGVDERTPQTLRWTVGGDAGCLVWRLRSWLAPTAPGGLGLTVRPYYEGLPISRLDAGRMNGGESCRDQGERNAPRPVTEERCRGQKSPQVERREARRPASSAGDLGRTRDRPDREAGHRVRRSAPAPVGALPPRFSEGHGKEGVPGASQKIRPAERWLSHRDIEFAVRCAPYHHRTTHNENRRPLPLR